MLKADPKRQAVAPLRGYAYQIWQSLYEWLCLGENELLFLEGAEDIDKLGPAMAETVQVKSTKEFDSITLKSKEALEAIAHFWDHQRKNPSIKIKFRFLTTAERGKERDSPFDGKKGIDYWDECKRAATLKPLKDFLSEQDLLPKELKEFILNSEDESLRNNFIRQIEWDTGSPQKEYLEEVIKKQLIYHGNRFNISPSESEKVLPALLKYVFDTACQKENRTLGQADFLRIFEDQTTERIPQTTLRALTNQMAQVVSLPSQSTGTISIVDRKDKKDLLQFLSPMLPKEFSRRENLIISLLEELRTKRLLVLKGSSGMGKSTIAALLAEKAEAKIKWLNLRGIEPETIREYLFLASANIGEFSDSLFVIDDINFGERSKEYEIALVGLLSIVLSKNGCIIITTQGDLPDKVRAVIPITDSSVVTVPLMNIEETNELILSYSCPSHKVNRWGTIILARTIGHPQLVHAKIRKLHILKWPDPSVDDLIKDDLEMVRREIRKRLISELPHDTARILLYRLSILLHPFRRDHALIMGQKTPLINNPGEAFDLLIGPWVEQLTKDYYRISPLLYDAAKEVYPQNEVKELHAYAAKALLSSKALSQIEASNSLFHGIIGETDTEILSLVQFLITTKSEILSKLADDIRWLTFFALESGQKIYSKNPFVSITLRHLQFRIAIETGDIDSTTKITKAWEKEIEELKNAELKPIARTLFLFETLTHHELPLPQKVVLSQIIEIISLIERLHKEDSKKLIQQSFKGKPLISYLILFATARCNNLNDFDEFISFLDNQSVELRKNMLSLLYTDDNWTGFLINKIYLSEYNSVSPNWNEFIVVFRKNVEKTLLWGITNIAVHAYHMIAVIYDEHLNNSAKALEVLQNAEKRLGQKYSTIEDARAMIFYRQKQYEKALEIWETILPNWETSFDIAPLMAYRKAEVSAAMLNNWDKAASLALEGKKVSEKLNKIVMAVGFQADYAFALWKSSKKYDSIRTFAEVVKKFKKLPDPNANLQSYGLQKIIGHALMWLLNDVKAEHMTTHVEPSPGCFSNSEIDEKIKEYPLQSIDFFWMPLAEIEYELGTGYEIFSYFKANFNNTKYPVIKNFVSKLTIQHSLRDSKVIFLVPEFKDFIVSMEISKKIMKEAKGVLQKSDIQITLKESNYSDAIIDLLFLALIILADQGRKITELIPKWKKDAQKNNLSSDELNNWFDFIESCLEKSAQELTEIMRDSNEISGKRLVASLLLSVKHKTSPQNVFYSHIFIFSYTCKLMWGKEIETLLENIVTNMWVEIANNQSFALLSPRITAPQILKVCNGSSKGFTKVAKILLSARNAVDLRIQESIISLLDQLSRKENGSI